MGPHRSILVFLLLLLFGDEEWRDEEWRRRDGEEDDE